MKKYSVKKFSIKLKKEVQKRKKEENKIKVNLAQKAAAL